MGEKRTLLLFSPLVPTGDRSLVIRQPRYEAFPQMRDPAGMVYLAKDYAWWTPRPHDEEETDYPDAEPIGELVVEIRGSFDSTGVNHGVLAMPHIGKYGIVTNGSDIDSRRSRCRWWAYLPGYENPKKLSPERLKRHREVYQRIQDGTLS